MERFRSLLLRHKEKAQIFGAIVGFNSVICGGLYFMGSNTEVSPIRSFACFTQKQSDEILNTPRVGRAGLLSDYLASGAPIRFLYRTNSDKSKAENVAKLLSDQGHRVESAAPDGLIRDGLVKSCVVELGFPLRN